MPRTMHFNVVKDLLSQNQLQQLSAQDDLVAAIGRRGGLADVMAELLPSDMDADEASWFASIPRVQQEAIRAVINDVVQADANESIEIQFTPAYDYSVKIFDYDKTVVIRVSGPLTGAPSARENFGSSA